MTDQQVIINQQRTMHVFSEIIWYVIGLIEILLLFRFALKLFSANASAPFTAFIYRASDVFVHPFQTVFNATYAQGSVFEWTTLLAMFVYWVVGMLIDNLFFTVTI